MDGLCKKLTSLAWLLREHREEVEYELLTNGFRLSWMGTGRLSWREAWLICKSVKPKSPLAVALNPRAAWDTTDYLMADIVDHARWLVWSKTKDAEKKPPRNVPKPMPRPGDKPGSGRFTDVQAMDVDEMKAYLARPRH